MGVRRSHWNKRGPDSEAAPSAAKRCDRASSDPFHCGEYGELIKIGPGQELRWCDHRVPGSYRRGRFEVGESAFALGAWSQDARLLEAISALGSWQSGYFEDPDNQEKLLDAYRPLVGIIAAALGAEAVAISDHPGRVFETTPFTEKVFDALYMEPSFQLAPGLTAKAFFEKAQGPSSVGTLGASILAFEKYKGAAERVCADKNKGMDDPSYPQIQAVQFALPDGSSAAADIYDFCFVFRRDQDGSLPLLKRMVSRILYDYMPASARQITF